MITQTDILIRILLAAALGALIGYERERQSQPAGLRTHVVLVVGSALAMCLSINLAMQFKSEVPNGDPARLAAQVLSGIGFLGAGAILRFGATVKGLTTAASLWTMAVVGLAVGIGYYLVAGGVTALLLIVLTLLNWVEARLIKPDLSLLFTVFAADRAGIESEVRATFQKYCSRIDYFRFNHHIRRQRVRINTLIKLHNQDMLEQLNSQLSAIQGVKIVKYE
jgi:putative Mg2+ transporter-C (MgtC) family protein